MRRRLLIIYVSLVAATIAALSIPVAITEAARQTQTVYIDRQGDTTRFASLAEPVLRSGQTVSLQAEFDVYRSLYGADAAVVNRAGEVVASSSTVDLATAEPELDRAVTAALAGERVGLDQVVWPWQRHRLIIAEPVGSGGEITGTVITISPTDRVRSATLRGWSVLALVALAALALAGFAAWPLTGWMLRPVSDLDTAAHQIAGGRTAARVHGAAGPPELRRLSLAFNAMADTIEGLLEQQKRFVFYASHQLRNPLTAVRLRMENLAEHVNKTGSTEHAQVMHDVDRLAAICDGLLAVAQAESLSARAEHKDLVDAAELADDRVDAWSAVARQAGVEIARTGVATALTRGELGALDQILDALIDNAIKFSGTGCTVVIDVAVAGADESWVVVSVSDDGPGMPPDWLEKAHEPFWRAPVHQNQEGSGLGLAIAATLAPAAGGTLELKPVAPHGLQAELRLQGLTSR